MCECECDLSPTIENILCSHRNRIWLTDWTISINVNGPELGLDEELERLGKVGVSDGRRNIWKYIWVSFCRTGKMSKIWPFFEKMEAWLWLNGLIFSSFLIFSEEIMSLGVYKYFCFGPSNSFWFLKISCFRPKILFSAIFWGQSRAAL